MLGLEPHFSSAFRMLTFHGLHRPGAPTPSPHDTGHVSSCVFRHVRMSPARGELPYLGTLGFFGQRGCDCRGAAARGSLYMW